MKMKGCALQCATCKDGTPNGCLSCESGLVLDGNTCSQQCSKANTFANSSSVCQGLCRLTKE